MAFIYKDVNPFFPTRQPILRDVKAVHASLFNLFNTRKGEVLFRPNYGINLEDRLFDPIDRLTALAIFREVVDAVEEFEPRVIINTSDTEVIPKPEDNAFELRLVFSIAGERSGGQSFEFTGSLVGAQ